MIGQSRNCFRAKLGMGHEVIVRFTKTHWGKHIHKLGLCLPCLVSLSFPFSTSPFSLKEKQSYCSAVSLSLSLSVSLIVNTAPFYQLALARQWSSEQLPHSHCLSLDMKNHGNRVYLAFQPFLVLSAKTSPLLCR